MKTTLLISLPLLVLIVWWSGWLTRPPEELQTTVIASIKNEASPEPDSKEISPPKPNPSQSLEPTVSQKLLLTPITPSVIVKNSSSPVRPKNMKDVSISSKLQIAIDEYPNYYEKLDYKLRFYDNLSSCLGSNAPKSGSIVIKLYYVIDETRRKATGSDSTDTGSEEAFQVIRSTLLQVDEDRVLFCAREAHVGQEMDITNGVYPETAKDFYRPTEIKFPINDNDIYWFLSHDGEYKNGAKE